MKNNIKTLSLLGLVCLLSSCAKEVGYTHGIIDYDKNMKEMYSYYEQADRKLEDLQFQSKFLIHTSSMAVITYVVEAEFDFKNNVIHAQRTHDGKTTDIWYWWSFSSVRHVETYGNYVVYNRKLCNYGEKMEGSTVTFRGNATDMMKYFEQVEAGSYIYHGYMDNPFFPLSKDTRCVYSEEWKGKNSYNYKVNTSNVDNIRRMNYEFNALVEHPENESMPESRFERKVVFVDGFVTNITDIYEGYYSDPLVTNSPVATLNVWDVIAENKYVAKDLEVPEEYKNTTGY